MLFSMVGMVILTVPASKCFDVEIITWGISHPATVLYRPSIKSGLMYLRNKFANDFNVSLTNLLELSVVDCDGTDDQIAYLASQWYYKRNISADLTAFIGPGEKILHCLIIYANVY